MDLSIFKDTHKRAKLFSMISGFIAVLAVIVMLIRSSNRLISFYFIIISLIILAVNAFFVYGNGKKILLIISVALFALSRLYFYTYYMNSLDNIFNNFIYLDYIEKLYFTYPFLIAAFFMSFIFINLYKKKYALFIASAILILSFLYFFLLYSFSFNYFIDEALYLIPYVLFLTFCPPDYKRENKNNSPFLNNFKLRSQMQKQKFENIETKLIQLKEAFELGNISQQVYESMKKDLVDQL